MTMGIYFEKFLNLETVCPCNFLTYQKFSFVHSEGGKAEKTPVGV